MPMVGPSHRPLQLFLYKDIKLEAAGLVEKNTGEIPIVMKLPSSFTYCDTILPVMMMGKNTGEMTVEMEESWGTAAG